MTLWLLLFAAALLSLERLCYIYISRAPERFRRFCTGRQWRILGSRSMSYGSSSMALRGFNSPCFSGGAMSMDEGSLSPTGRGILPLAIGRALIVAGQMLNCGVFYRLGKVGVFYGNKLGYDIPWSRAFPFSWFKHPQYVGTVWSIWGFFLIMRFPHTIGICSPRSKRCITCWEPISRVDVFKPS